MDRESAYETLTGKVNAAPAPGQPEAPVPPPGAPAEAPPQAPPEEEGGGMFAKVGAFFSSPLGRQVTSSVTREITRSLFGTRRR